MLNCLREHIDVDSRSFYGEWLNDYIPLILCAIIVAFRVFDCGQ